jgi:ribonuclease HI
VSVYTDGSKTTVSSSAAVVFPDHSFSVRLPSWASNFTAELAAILLALHLILHHHTSNSFTLFSDSRSALLTIIDITNPHPIVSLIHTYLIRLHSRHKNVTFCWVPAHVNIPGNTQADTLAKQAHSSPFPPPSLPHQFPSTKVPVRDLYPYINQHLQRSWQRRWTSTPSHPYLHLLFSDVPRTPPQHIPNRLYSVLRTRLLLGHTLFTHQHLMSGSPPPECPFCLIHTPVTVLHILLFCPRLLSIRKRFFKDIYPINPHTALRSLLLSTNTRFFTVISYLNTIKLLNNI